MLTAGLAESNGSLPSGLWLTSPAGWLPRTGISSGTLRSVIEYGLPLLFNTMIWYGQGKKEACRPHRRQAVERRCCGHPKGRPPPRESWDSGWRTGDLAVRLQVPRPPAVLPARSVSTTASTLSEMHVKRTQNEWMNEYLFYRHRYNTAKTVKNRTVSTWQKGSEEHLQLP